MKIEGLSEAKPSCVPTERNQLMEMSVIYRTHQDFEAANPSEARFSTKPNQQQNLYIYGHLLIAIGGV